MVIEWMFRLCALELCTKRGGHDGCHGDMRWTTPDRRGSRGGGPRVPLSPISESLGIDFYSGFRKKIQVYTFIVASEKKNTRGGAIRNPKKSRYRLL